MCIPPPTQPAPTAPTAAQLREAHDRYKHALEQISARPPIPTIFRLADEALHPPKPT